MNEESGSWSVSESYFEVSLAAYGVASAQQQLCYVSQGRQDAKQSVLLIHGIGDSKEDCLAAFRHRSAERFQLVAVDLLGFGKSTKPVDCSYDLELQAAALRELLTELQTDSVHIVAHSVGGAVGLLLAEKLGSLVRSFISVEGNLIAEDCGIITRRVASMSFEEYLTTAYIERLADLQRAGRSNYCHQLMLPLAFYRTAQSTVSWSDSGRLLSLFQNVPCKRHYIFGEQNADYPVLQQLADISTYAIPGAGHRPMDDNPSDYFDTVFRCIEAAA